MKLRNFIHCFDLIPVSMQSCKPYTFLEEDFDLSEGIFPYCLHVTQMVMKKIEKMY
jgi:hypothetical protein